MKLKMLAAVTLAITASLSLNVHASGNLNVSEWVDDKGPVEKYNILTKPNGLKGVTNKNGDEIIDAIYKDIKLLPDWDKFAVQDKNGKWTITNVGGERFFKDKYDFIDTKYYDKGFVAIGINGENEFNNKAGIIDKDMNMIVPVEYQSYLYTGSKLFVGKLNSNNEYDYYTLNEDNSLLYTATLPGILSSNADNTYYINSYRVCREHNTDNNQYSSGYITTIGLADNDFNVIIEPVYENKSFAFNNGVAIVKKGSTAYTISNSVSEKIGNGKYGIIDKEGNEITECKYDSITRIGNSYTLTLNGEKEALKLNELYNNTGEIKIKVNGIQLKSHNSPVVIDNSVLLPLRDITEALDANLEWNNETKTAVITNNNKTVSISAGSNEILVNNKPVQLSTPAQIINNITYIPVRGISTALDCKVNWDNNNKIVSITK